MPTRETLGRGFFSVWANGLPYSKDQPGGYKILLRVDKGNEEHAQAPSPPIE